MRLVVCGLLVTIGCRKPHSATEVAGTYVAKYPFGVETLILTVGGEFVQVFVVATNSALVVARGTWTYDPDPDDARVRLRNCLLVNDGDKLRSGYDKPIDSGIVSYPFSRKNRIEIDPDLGYYYEKVR